MEMNNAGNATQRSEVFTFGDLRLVTYDLCLVTCDLCLRV